QCKRPTGRPAARTQPEGPLAVLSIEQWSQESVADIVEDIVEIRHFQLPSLVDRSILIKDGTLGILGLHGSLIVDLGDGVGAAVGAAGQSLGRHGQGGSLGLGRAACQWGAAVPTKDRAVRVVRVA